MRRFYLLGFLLLITAVPLSAIITTSTVAGPDLVFSLQEAFPNLNTGFSPITDIANAGDGRLFIVEQQARILVLDNDPAATGYNVFLDITDRVNESDGEKGLLGLAFHPDYTDNGYFFVNYTRREGGQLYTYISRFQVTADPNTADPNSEATLLKIPQPYDNHNGGDLNFGPDGYLYASLGDGGSGGDPGGNGQNKNTLLGSILRLDVDQNVNTPPYHGVPADNPFVGEDGADEIWAYGLRNPWRFSFDALTGDLWIGDVGQHAWEEIDFESADSAGGVNYGWNIREGAHCYPPGSSCDPAGLTDPVAEYSQDNGRCSVTGGYVYRGGQYPVLTGRYLYADYCSGDIWGLTQDGNGRWESQLLLPANQSQDNIRTFGEDVNSELFLVTGNTVYRIQENTVLDHKIHLPLVTSE